MTEQRGRDRDEIPERENAQVERSSGSPTATGSEGGDPIGMPGGASGGEAAVRSEEVDFDTRGRQDDLDASGRRAQRANEVSTGRNPGEGDAQTAYGGFHKDPSVDYGEDTLSVPGDFATTMRTVDENDPSITGGMGSGTGDDDGISQGLDMDMQAARGDIASTGTSERAGLGGRSSGTDMDPGPRSGSGMANVADMGPQS